jgi:hypothetical protein
MSIQSETHENGNGGLELHKDENGGLEAQKDGNGRCEISNGTCWKDAELLESSGSTIEGSTLSFSLELCACNWFRFEIPLLHDLPLIFILFR